MTAKIKVKLSTFSGQQNEVEAVSIGEYFAAHHTPANGTEFHRQWTVTHIPSGKAVFHFLPTQREALRLGRLLHAYATRAGLNLRAKTLKGIGRGNKAGLAKLTEYRGRLLAISRK